MTSLPAAMPRGVRLPRGARRLQLLAAAQEVFVANGYHAAAMDDIASRAGVSKPVLYQHFPGKLDLYLALVDRAADLLVGRIREALASTTDNKQRVAATTQAYFDFIDDPSGIARLLFDNDLTNEEAVTARLERVTEECAVDIAAIIAEDTGLSEDESMLLAVALVGQSQFSARYWLQNGRGLSREHAATLVSTLGWRGIRGFPRRDEPPTS